MSDFKSLLHFCLFLFRNTVNRTNIKDPTIIFRNYKKKVLPFYPNLTILNNRRLFKKGSLVGRPAGLLSGRSRVQMPAGPTLIDLKITEEKVLPSQ